MKIYLDNIQKVVRKEKGQKLKYLKNFGTGWAFMPDSDALVFVDNHGKFLNTFFRGNVST